MTALIVLMALGCSPTTPVSEPASAEPAPAAAAPAVSTELPAVVATYAGKQVTAAELEKAAMAGVMAAKQQMFDAQNKALDQLIVEDLLETEAKKKGHADTDALLKAEVQDKLAEPSDEAAEAFFNENKARMPGDFASMSDRIKEHLQQQGAGEAMMAYVNELKKGADVKTFLSPPRFTVAAGSSPRKGSETAPIQIIEFSDFQCPYCTKAAETVDEVAKKYGDKVSIVYKHFPLNFHDRAHRAAQASACANDQGKFWAYHDQLFINQKSLGEEDLTRHAETAQLDVAAFTACLASDKHVATVDADMELGESLGMTGTPGFYINGRMLSGAQPLEAFSEIIDDELGS